MRDLFEQRQPAVRVPFGVVVSEPSKSFEVTDAIAVVDDDYEGRPGFVRKTAELDLTV